MFKQLIHLIQLIGRPSLYLLTAILVFSSKLILKLKKIKLKKIRFFKKKKKAKSKKKVKKKKAKTKKIIFPSFIFSTLVLVVIIFLFYDFFIKDLPSVQTLTDNPPSLSTKIYDRHDQLLYKIYKDENRSLISLNELPAHLIDATLAAEDKNFYHHFGVDISGITRATLNNFKCSIFQIPCNLQGGSTITQQLVKNTLLTPERTYTRKIKELILSFLTEWSYSKPQILEMYLNQVGYGGTAYGIEEASRSYFNKSAKDLSLAESAMLAGLPIAPTILSPFGTNPQLGKIRQQQVLESMVQLGKITEDQKVEAINTPLIFHPQKNNILAPHFVMYVKDLLVKKYGEDVVSRGGLIVKTTLDLEKQDILQTEINEELKKIAHLKVQNGAGLITEPKTGHILAMVGSKDFFDPGYDGQVNLTIQSRQPGSSIKPITYALALSRGLNPYSTIDDTPICFTSKGQPNYCPKNYDGKFHGKVTLKTALASSYNIPAVKLLNTFGLGSMIELGKSMGITTWNDTSRFGLSLTLGGGEITMLDLATVYSVFANYGTKVELQPIISISDSHGNSLYSASDHSPTQRPEVLSPSVAYQINAILSDPSARAPAFGLNSVLNLPGKNVAVKTGTTNSLRDNWTFGYTQDYLVATWVGNNDNTPMSQIASGITGASPIWAKTMQKLITDKKPAPFLPPSNMIKIDLSCNSIPKFEYFVPGNIASKNCNATPSGTLLNSSASTAR